MNLVRSNDIIQKHPWESFVIGLVYDALLPTGVTISSVEAPEIATERGTSSTALTLSGAAPNAVQFAHKGDTIAVGRGVQATLAGGTARCRYAVTVKGTCSNSEKVAVIWTIEVKA